MKKLIVFGDSILKGVMYNAETGRYKLYSGNLEERLRQREIELVKNCKMGITSQGIAQRVDALCEEEQDLSSTMVFLEFGGNDSAYDWKQVSANPRGLHSPVTTQDQFETNYQAILDKLKNRGASVTVGTLPPIDPDKYLNFISKDLSRDNILSWLGDVSMLYRWHETYNYRVLGLAERNHCRIIDLRTRFLTSHDFGSLICGDGMHPTNVGHAMIENMLAEAF